ncbi:UNVERIFIED_CONTAM: hypothetical protein H355_002502 [Colinus virginianus]|nr:hypothetical protein H355_002502 [Colinus virginianus]
MHFLIFYFAGRKDENLVAQGEQMEIKDAVLKEQAEEIERKDAELKEQSKEIGESPTQQTKNVVICGELWSEMFISPCIAFAFLFAERKDAKLKEQAEEMEKQAAEMEEEFEGTVKVTLDPCTANPLLSLSEDLRSVSRVYTRQHLPDLQERFDTMCCVLGQEGFREGRHCWEVEVMRQQGKYPWCALGVARASVKRKGEIDLSLEEGIWALRYDEGKLEALTAPPTLLTPSPVPTRIWVCLDYAQERVTFINALNGTEIFTFQSALFNGEKVLPWFWLRMNAELCLRDSSP